MWVCDCCLRAGQVFWGEAGELYLAGWDAGALRSEPVSSEEPAPPLLHLELCFCDLARLEFFACFWDVSPRRTSAAGFSVGSESRDEDDVNSEYEPLVDTSGLATALACGYTRERGENEGWDGVEAEGRPALFSNGDWAPKADAIPL